MARGRRGKPSYYFIKLEDRLVRFAAYKWHAWIERGWLRRLGDRIAEPARAGIVWLEDGILHLRPDPIYPWIRLNCREWVFWAIFEYSCDPS